MHGCPRCNHDPVPCNSRCQPDDGLHADLWYAMVPDATCEYIQWVHDHACDPSITIVHAVRTHEAPLCSERYPPPKRYTPDAWNAHFPYAYLVIYHVANPAQEKHL